MPPRPPPPPSAAPHPPSSTTARGRDAEQRAAAWIVHEGLELVDRNVRAGGVELDIVARFRADVGASEARRWPALTYAFIEVRSRAHARLGAPEQTIDADKRARLRRGATAWLMQARLLGRVAVRFDVIAVVLQRDARPFAAPPAAPVRGWPWPWAHRSPLRDRSGRSAAQLQLAVVPAQRWPAHAPRGVLELHAPPTNDAPGATLRWYLGAFEG